MTTHYAEFMKGIEAGKPVAIYSHKPDGKDFYRLYDGNLRHDSSHNNHACVTSRLTADEVQAAVHLAKTGPKAFAELYL